MSFYRALHPEARTRDNFRREISIVAAAMTMTDLRSIGVCAFAH
jgi:hypothetical protein